MDKLKTYSAIGVGGMLGACLRYGIDFLFLPKGLFPWTTLFINISGAFLLAFILFQPFLRFIMKPFLHRAVTVGFLGSFTTFSTITLEIFLLSQVDLLCASLYAVLTISLGLIASFLGYRTALVIRLGKEKG